MPSIEMLRSYRLGPYATFDLIVSFLGVAILSPILTRLFRLFHLEISLLSWIYLTLPISILAHLVVGNQTLMTKQFLDPSGHYVLKVFLLSLLVLGISRIKIIK